VSGIDAAIARVDSNVLPKECFVTYKGGDRWEPIPGTGCAHWVSHQKGIPGTSGGNGCLAGFAIRVPDVKTGRQAVTLNDVQVGDIWAGRHPAHGDHTGIVTKVEPQGAGKPPKVWIKHNSTGPNGRGLPTDPYEWFKNYPGAFYR
jgi:hypothetical protein